MKSDWECLDLALEGNERAWQTLYDRHFSRLVRMASLITGSPDAAQDIAQESFIRLLRYPILHRNGSVRSLLTTITYRLALKEKKRDLDVRSGNDEPADSAPSPLESAIADETDRLLIRTLTALPSQQREVIALRFFGGHSYEEIAEMTGVPIGTVKSRIFNAIRNCQKTLQEGGI